MAICSFQTGARLALMLLACAGGAAAGQSTTLAVSANVLSKSNCKFDSNAVSALNFNIDPSSASDLTVSTTRTFTCNGSANPASFSVTASNGNHASGGTRRMRHGVTLTAYLPYTLSFSPASGSVAKGASSTLTISGTVASADFQPALLGSYSDTVTVTLSP
ncbi:spore coat protein U domain-containing protein [Ramlibacter tataouinensis]|uniref:spore coat protein U domain-containing protein n=1 Tax=Ramlibacter tataouinensis TaxID=94132 RepID=UPI0022F3EF8F|nr:spore coat protein U domain-containing protein [Ramlibacter tataouinensis]WBY03761.1 spore coat protein U domain-containing protein [Ramlibacter tataouinensis]